MFILYQDGHWGTGVNKGFCSPEACVYARKKQRERKKGREGGEKCRRERERRERVRGSEHTQGRVSMGVCVIRI